MDHLVIKNPYLKSVDPSAAEARAAEEKFLADLEAQQREQQERIDAALAADIARVEESERKAKQDYEEEKERIAEENAAAREIREYDSVLAESNLEHVRQPNEAPENYADVPKSGEINVTDNDVHNDGELDGEFGRVQAVEIPSLDEVIAQEQEEREATIANQADVMDVILPTAPPEDFVLPAAPSNEE